VITEFKIYSTKLNSFVENKFENIQEPKFKVSDRVYTNGKFRAKPNYCKIIKVIPMAGTDNNCNRYVLDRYTNLSVREDALISEYEFDAKKYNL
jgi:hypothetical protein